MNTEPFQHPVLQDERLRIKPRQSSAHAGPRDGPRKARQSQGTSQGIRHAVRVGGFKAQGLRLRHGDFDEGMEQAVSP